MSLIAQLKEFIPGLSDETYTQILQKVDWKLERAFDEFFSNEGLYRKKPETELELIPQISKIQVDIVYEIANGFSGMQRDLILRLCKLLWFKENGLRMIFGMCKDYIPWIPRKFFRLNRLFNIPIFFHPVPNGGYVTTVYAPTRTQCQFTAIGHQTIFMSGPLTAGVYRWTVKISYTNTERSFLCVGAASNPVHKGYSGMSLGCTQESCALILIREENGTLHTDLLHRNQRRPVQSMLAPDGSLVSIEADMSYHTVAFFIGERKVPLAVSRAFALLQLGVTGHYRTSFISVRFCKLPFSTPSSVVCRYFPLKKDG